VVNLDSIFDNQLVYLASPYTDYSTASDIVMESRFEKAKHATACLMRFGVHVFSPIVHCHPLATTYDLPKHFMFWQSYDELMVSRCDLLIVLGIDGWDRSHGVASEIEIARRLNKLVLMLEPEQLTSTFSLHMRVMHPTTYYTPDPVIRYMPEREPDGED